MNADPRRADPRPWLRCRCVALEAIRGDPAFWARCPERPTAEDGVCDHCRQPVGACTDPLCTIPENCCITAPGRRALVDLRQPCAPARGTVAPF